MTTKHTPATPLPITSACDEEFRANAEEGRKYRAEQERRANAYPRLVEALRNARAGFISAYLRGAEIANTEKRGSRAALVGLDMQKYAQSGQDDVDALLRELGEE